MSNATVEFKFNETWTLTRAGNIVWGAACLLGALCMLIFRGRPSNGINLTYLVYLLTHTALITIVLLMDGLNLEVTHVDKIPLLTWWIDMLMILASGVFVRLFALLVFRVNGCFLSKLSWVNTALLWGAVTTLQYLNLPVIAWYVYTGYYLLGCALVLFTLLKEWCQAMCCSPRYYKQVKAKGVFSGWSNKAFTSLGLIGVIVGIGDYVVLIMAAHGITIWEYEFLSRLLDSVIYIPFVVLFFIWADCPTNIKMHGICDEQILADEEGLEAETDLGLKNNAFDGKNAL